MNIEPITTTIPKAREITGLGNTTIYKLIGEGRLKTVKVGRRTLIVFSSLKALTAGRAG